MIILAHRGYWIEAAEKNSVRAFDRSFSAGFGVETDIRDSGRDLYIAHDMASGKEQRVSEFLDQYSSYDMTLTLALNVKADGLQATMKSLLQERGITRYFFFDMSLPDALGYARNGLIFYTRQSEYEEQPYLYEEAAGIWLDEFNGHWITEEVILAHYKKGKKICIVSPELHKRNYEEEWQHYRDIERKYGLQDLMLCSDFPQEAQKFFNQ